FTSTKQDKPNIIIITSDSLRADHLGIYGYPYNTSPNIDNFAKDATLFKNAYSQAPWTIPSAGTLYTSLYPKVHNFYIVQHKEQVLAVNRQVSFLHNQLESYGYTTALIAGNIVLELFSDKYLPKEYSFDTVLVSENDFSWNSSNMTEAAINHIEQIKNKGPFFINLWYMDPHSPYAPSEEFNIFNHTQYTNKTIEENYNINKYDGEILSTDTSIGTFLAYLKENNLYDNSLILFIADHGEQFGEHGEYEHGNTVREVETHVPFILKLPKNSKYKLNKIEEKPVGLIDIYPTILDILRIEYPEYIQGRSIFDILNDKEKTYVFSELADTIDLGNDNYIYREEYSLVNTILNSLVVGYVRVLNSSDEGTLEETPGRIIELKLKGKPTPIIEIQNYKDIYDEFSSNLVSHNEKNLILLQNLSESIKEVSISRDTLEKMKALGYLQ
ncbi:MAG: sulfatase, partial [Nanoarchaeota archaeon]